jgi:hypothetical protein
MACIPGELDDAPSQSAVWTPRRHKRDLRLIYRSSLDRTTNREHLKGSIVKKNPFVLTIP